MMEKPIGEPSTPTLPARADVMRKAESERNIAAAGIAAVAFGFIGIGSGIGIGTFQSIKHTNEVAPIVESWGGRDLGTGIRISDVKVKEGLLCPPTDGDRDCYHHVSVRRDERPLLDGAYVSNEGKDKHLLRTDDGMVISDFRACDYGVPVYDRRKKTEDRDVRVGLPQDPCVSFYVWDQPLRGVMHCDLKDSTRVWASSVDSDGRHVLKCEAQTVD